MTQVDQVSGLLTDLYIGGTAIPAAAGGRFDVLDPATELGREEWAYFESRGEKRTRKFVARGT